MNGLLVVFVIACALSGISAQTISAFTGNITKTGCGTSKLCFTSCDPSTNSNNCTFGSSQSVSNSLIYELSSNTTGYVALGLANAANADPSIVFICLNNNNTVNATANLTSSNLAVNTNSNGSFTFLTTNITNGTFNLITVNTVNVAQGVVKTVNNVTVVQCTFNTTTNLTTKAANSTTSYSVTLLTGTFDNGALGKSTTQFNSNGTLDLTNPSANNVTSTTAAPTTTKGGSDSLAGPAARVLAIMLGAFGLLLMY